jgi:hypothetical protein
MNKQLQDVIRVCEKTNKELLYCSQCGKLAIKVKSDRQFSWARNLYCVCGQEWAVCGNCSNGRVRMLTNDMVRKHNFRCTGGGSNIDERGRSRVTRSSAPASIKS